MEYSLKSWLDTLVKHSIFELKDEAKQSVQSLKSEQTRPQNDITSFILQHHTRVIAIRDSDLLVAVGPQIRALNLTEFKDTWIEYNQNFEEEDTNENWIHSFPYKILEAPEINFSIESLIPNKNGRLLSVTGGNHLVIVLLPRQSFADYSDAKIPRKKIDCQTLSVGSGHYNGSKSIEILKVEWHPLSDTFTHIVVLSSDNMLRIFDISEDIKDPEQSFDLSLTVTKDNSSNKPNTSGAYDFDLDNSTKDVVTFSLGGASQKESGWEPFTVLYALRNGQIHALCPVIPYKSSVRCDHLNNLQCISETKHEQSKKSASPHAKSLARLFSLQGQWLNDLVKSAKMNKNNTDELGSDNTSVYSNDGHNKYPVQKQGPFVINHSKIDEKIEPVDLLFINADPINVLALALNNGTLHNYFLTSEIEAQWQMPTHNTGASWEKDLGTLLSDPDFLPTAALHEKINLVAEQSLPYQRVTLVLDPLCTDTYYAYYAGGVKAIAMAKWLDELCMLTKSHESGNNADARKRLENWLKEKSKSEITTLVNTSPFGSSFTPIVGLLLISDIYLSYSLICITSDYRVVTRELNIRHEPSNSKEVEEATKAQLKNVAPINEDDEPNYHPIIPLPAFQPPSELDSIPKHAKIVVPADLNGSKEIVINEETVRFILKCSEQVRRDAHQLKIVSKKIENRLKIQQTEFKRQVETVRDLYDQLQTYQSAEAKAAQEEKLKETARIHAKLRVKIDTQLRKLMNSYQPGLSNEEKEWIEKLEKLQKQISGDSGYAARIELLKNQVKELKEPKQHQQASKRNSNTNISSHQLKNVLHLLEGQTTPIEEIKERISKLDTKLPTSVA